jgi:hypothetical protein
LRKQADFVAAPADALPDARSQLTMRDCRRGLAQPAHRPRDGPGDEKGDADAGKECKQRQPSQPLVGKPARDDSLRRQHEERVDVSVGPDELIERPRRPQIAEVTLRRLPARTETPHGNRNGRRQLAPQQVAAPLIQYVDGRRRHDRQ